MLSCVLFFSTNISFTEVCCFRSETLIPKLTVWNILFFWSLLHGFYLDTQLNVLFIYCDSGKWLNLHYWVWRDGYIGIKVQSDPDSITAQTVRNDVHAMQCILFMFCWINKRKVIFILPSIRCSHHTLMWLSTHWSMTIFFSYNAHWLLARSLPALYWTNYELHSSS